MTLSYLVVYGLLTTVVINGGVLVRILPDEFFQLCKQLRAQWQCVIVKQFVDIVA